MVENRSEEDLDTVAVGIVECDDLFGVAVAGVGLGEDLDLDAGLLDSFANTLKSELIAHFPAHCECLVRLTRKDDQSRATLVQAEVEAVGFRATTNREAESVNHELAPASHVLRLDPEISQAPNFSHA